MLGLTPLGTVHTAISLVAVGCGLVALIRDKQISSKNLIGQIYLVTTAITCLTSFGIFQHGGFGKPHVLSILTLVVMAIAALAERARLFGARSRYVAAVGYSMTFLFHLIPAITETATRVPLGAPLLTSPDAPELKAATGALFVLFLIGALLQVRRIRTQLT